MHFKLPHHKPFFIAGLAGILTILFSLFLSGTAPAEAGKEIDGLTDPILAFEFAKTAEEVRGLFSFPTAEEKFAFASAINLHTKIDFGFMLVYCSFLALFCFLAWKLSGNKIYLAGIVLAIFAFFGDGIENLQILTMTATLGENINPQTLNILFAFTWLKWGSISLISALAGIWFLQSKGYWKILCLPLFLPLVLAVPAILNRELFTNIFVLSIAGTFLVLTVFSLAYRRVSA